MLLSRIQEAVGLASVRVTETHGSEDAKRYGYRAFVSRSRWPVVEKWIHQVRTDSDYFRRFSTLFERLHRFQFNLTSTHKLNNNQDVVRGPFLQTRPGWRSLNELQQQSPRTYRLMEQYASPLLNQKASTLLTVANWLSQANSVELEDFRVVFATMSAASAYSHPTTTTQTAYNGPIGKPAVPSFHVRAEASSMKRPLSAPMNKDKSTSIASRSIADAAAAAAESRQCQSARLPSVNYSEPQEPAPRQNSRSLMMTSTYKSDFDGNRLREHYQGVPSRWGNADIFHRRETPYSLFAVDIPSTTYRTTFNRNAVRGHQHDPKSIEDVATVCGKYSKTASFGTVIPKITPADLWKREDINPCVDYSPSAVPQYETRRRGDDDPAAADDDSTSGGRPFRAGSLSRSRSVPSPAARGNAKTPLVFTTTYRSSYIPPDLSQKTSQRTYESMVKAARRFQEPYALVQPIPEQCFTTTAKSDYALPASENDPSRAFTERLSTRRALIAKSETANRMSAPVLRIAGL